LALESGEIINTARWGEFLWINGEKVAKRFVSTRLVEEFDYLLFSAFIQRNSHG
jgi:hypothetical protein